MSIELKRLGKYELLERLGHGGMAEVWKALDTQLQRHVAIKILHADLQADPDFVARFEREARVVASLYHPNIVQVHDFQTARPPEVEGTVAYMVMDYIEGQTLDQYIRSTSRQGHFPSATDIVHLFASLSSAIDYAHQQGMIHRDLKPANILLDKRLGEPIITDFGIAKLMSASTGSMSGSWLSTPLYISPEQVQGAPGNERSDVYSLGVILYEICTGALPFKSNNPSTIMMQHLNEAPPAPSSINPNIPPALSLVILRSLAKDPAIRFPTASSLAAALAEAFMVPMPDKLKAPTYPKDVLDQPTHYGSLLASLPAGASPSVTPILSATSTPILAYTPSGVSSPSPVQLPTTPLPPVLAPPARKRPRMLFIVLPVLGLLILLGGGIGAFLLHSLWAPPVPPAPPGGTAFFVSSDQWSVTSNQGIEDKLQVTLHNIPALVGHSHYYVWLVSDKTAFPNGASPTGTVCKKVTVPPQYLALGPLSVDQGSVNFTYSDSQHTNLLGRYSGILITEENATSTPQTPSLKAGRFSAAFPETPDKLGKCLSVLDYLRHLLSEGSKLQLQGVHGGQDFQLLQHVQKILEWATSSRESWGSNSEFIHRQVVRILDYLDGSSLVNQDVPAGTPLLVDPLLAQLGVIKLATNSSTDSYMSRIDNHLHYISRGPGVSATMRQQALQTDKVIPGLLKWLEQIHLYAKQLVVMDNSQLQQTSTLSLLDSLETQATYAFAGRLDPATNALEAGAIQLHYRIQQLATFEIQPYKVS